MRPRQRTVGQSLVNAVEHGAGTDLVGQVVCCVYLLAVDFCGDVDGHEVLVSCGALNGLQGAEALTQSVQCLNLVLSGDLYLVNLNLETLVVGQLDFGADGDGDGQLDVCLTVLGGGLGLNVQLGLCQGRVRSRPVPVRSSRSERRSGMPRRCSRSPHAAR